MAKPIENRSLNSKVFEVANRRRPISGYNSRNRDTGEYRYRGSRSFAGLWSVGHFPATIRFLSALWTVNLLLLATPYLQRERARGGPRLISESEYPLAEHVYRGSNPTRRGQPSRLLLAGLVQK